MAKVVGILKDKEVLAYDFKEMEVKGVGDYEILMTGSTEDQDRDGEVVLVDAWDLKNYKKNPVILAMHDYRQPAIARAKKIIKVDKKLQFLIEFPKEGVYDVSDVYRKLYKGGFMNASSVGFWPKAWEDGDGKKTPYRTFKETELLELSLVTVPSNFNALAEQRGIKEALAKGVLTEKDVAILKAYIKNVFKGGASGTERDELQMLEGAEIKDEGEEGEVNHMAATSQNDGRTDTEQMKKKLENDVENLKKAYNEINICVDKITETLKDLMSSVDSVKEKIEKFKIEKGLDDISHYLDIEDDEISALGADEKVADIKDVLSETFK